MKCRLIIEEAKSGALNMATDEILLSNSIKNVSDGAILRIYGWSPSCVSLGYFEKINDCVDIEYAKKNKIDITRRITGGGHVFHDKEITYSLIIPEKGIKSSRIEDSYAEILHPVIGSLEKIGISSKMSGINDIIVVKNNKKISGSAQTRRNGYVLQHGTILLDIDIEKMSNLIKIPVEKLNDKQIKSISERITSIKDNVHGYDTVKTKKMLIDHIIEEFTSDFDFEYDITQLTDEENLLISNLAKERFSSIEWINRR